MSRSSRVIRFFSSHVVVDTDSSLKMRSLRERWNKQDLRSSGLHPRSSIPLEIRPRPETSVRLAKRLHQCSDLSILLAAIKVGVPVVPGTPGPVAAYTDAKTFIDEHGFPGVHFPPTDFTSF